MIDFKKHLGAKPKSAAPVDPLRIYDSLDRASDKGPLRPAQESVLRDWHQQRRSDNDVIVKLHTGQGKTLIGLLILQSKLNEGKGPALYLCPSALLVTQTCDQASQFGISYTTTQGELPVEFLDSKKILITTVQKLFTGLTKFRLAGASIPVGAIVIDDSHACIDEIREAFTIKLPSDHAGYLELLRLFQDDLRAQGAGTYAELKAGQYGSFLPVPYWRWVDRTYEVTEILAAVSGTKEVKFAWPLIKDSLADCLCVVSGEGLEIAPHLAPLDLFGSYRNASHRVFMSATVADDSFFIKGLELTQKVIESPLVYAGESWSGEKMILLPSLISGALTRENVVRHLAPPSTHRNVGFVVLVPSFARSKDWEAYGAMVAGTKDIENQVDGLRAGRCQKTLVIANRYDGIDLPDGACRVLVLDSLPRRLSIMDRYLDSCRYSSQATQIKSTRIIEQGLGRAVRGERDYCAILLIGPELISHVRTEATRSQFSPQTRKQIEIGLAIAEMKDGDADGDPVDVLRSLVRQLIGRDEGWKQYHAEQMDSLGAPEETRSMLAVVSLEAEAERHARRGRRAEAKASFQKIVDEHTDNEVDKAWYLQEMARVVYPLSKAESNTLQIAAHDRNRFLLRPESGVVVKRIQPISERRVERLRGWLRQRGSFEQIRIAVDAILEGLRFGAPAETFEKALQEAGQALGLQCERPDKEWKAGPDNLWGIRDGEFVLFECKNEVEETRAEISKKEAGQINNAIGWFRDQYSGAVGRNLMVIPARRLAAGAALNAEVEIVRRKELDGLKKNFRRFFGEFAALDVRDLSDGRLQELLNVHRLSSEDLMKSYAVGVRR